MEKGLYLDFFEQEHKHWWFKARRDIIISLLKKQLNFSSQNNPKILDIGCGTGLILEQLEALTPKAEGLDMSEEAITYAKKIGIHSPIHRLSFPEDAERINERYDAVLMLDVIEHIKDDAAALRGVYDLLKPGGVAILAVPAHPWLWSEYDEYCHHERRYTRRSFIDLIATSQFKIQRLSYYNFWLFFPIAVFRFLKKFVPSKTKRSSDVFLPSNFINALLYRIFSSEHQLLTKTDLPIGVSMLTILKKPD